MRVGIPKQLNDLRPAGDFLDFVDDQQRTIRMGARLEPGQVPLLLQPCLIPQRGLVGGRVVRGKAGCFDDLAGERGLADLAWTGQNLDKTARFPHTGKQLGIDGCAFHWFYSGH